MQNGTKQVWVVAPVQPGQAVRGTFEELPACTTPLTVVTRTHATLRTWVAVVDWPT